MARFRADFQGHLLVVSGHQPVQEAADLLGETLLALVEGHAPLVGLFAVPPQADLPHHPLKELRHVVLEGGRRLDELAVEDDGTSSALCTEKSIPPLEPLRDEKQRKGPTPSPGKPHAKRPTRHTRQANVTPSDAPLGHLC